MVLSCFAEFTEKDVGFDNPLTHKTTHKKFKVGIDAHSKR